MKHPVAIVTLSNFQKHFRGLFTDFFMRFLKLFISLANAFYFAARVPQPKKERNKFDPARSNAIQAIQMEERAPGVQQGKGGRSA